MEERKETTTLSLLVVRFLCFSFCLSRQEAKVECRKFTEILVKNQCPQSLLLLLVFCVCARQTQTKQQQHSRAEERRERSRTGGGARKGTSRQTKANKVCQCNVRVFVFACVCVFVCGRFRLKKRSEKCSVQCLLSCSVAQCQPVFAFAFAVTVVCGHREGLPIIDSPGNQREQQQQRQ